MRPLRASEDKNMQNENRNEEAVSPVIATILMVAITVVLAGVLYVWASQLAEGNTDGDFSMYGFAVTDAEDHQQPQEAKTASTSQWTLVTTYPGQLSSYRCLLMVVLTQSAPTLTKQPTLAVQSLTTAMASGRSEKKSLLAKEPTTSAVALHAVFRSRFSTSSSNKLIYESTVTRRV